MHDALPDLEKLSDEDKRQMINAGIDAREIVIPITIGGPMIFARLSK
ncbi:MAG: hypothetical protein NTV99_12675 [Deltaproteobacteria bacterium]|nr:hypothetical protein [Deltaproteobacteria bacterium]